MVAFTNGAHSAEIEMRLIVGAESISIRQMAPDFLLIEPTSERAPCEATIVIRVDQNESEWKVRLPKGISKSSSRVQLALLEEESTREPSERAAVS